MMRSFCVLFSFACCFAQGHGTAIAVIRNDAGIAIATDSRVVDMDGKILPNTCKIISAGRWHFTLNGLATAPGMNAFDIVKRILIGKGQLSGKVMAVKDTLQPLLNSAMQRDPGMRADAIRQGSVMGVTIFGYENAAFKLAAVRFAVRKDSVLAPEQHICPADCPYPNNSASVIVPSYDEPRINRRLPLVSAVTEFVQMEITKGATDIGGPIQIMKIGSRGRFEWIGTKPDVCKD